MLKTALLTLLTEFLKEVFEKLMHWLTQSKKSFKTFINSLKKATNNFIRNLKSHIVNISESALATAVTVIVGPVVNTLQRVWTFLRQGLSSLKEAIMYLQNPKYRNDSLDVKIMSISKIIVGGISGCGAIILSELIEKQLDAIPGFSVEIPGLGSLSNILGIFSGSLASGIIGAVIINGIDQLFKNNEKKKLDLEKISKINSIISIEDEIAKDNKKKYEIIKSETEKRMTESHNYTDEYMDLVTDAIMSTKAESCINSKIEALSKHTNKKELSMDTIDAIIGSNAKGEK